MRICRKILRKLYDFKTSSNLDDVRLIQVEHESLVEVFHLIDMNNLVSRNYEVFSGVSQFRYRFRGVDNEDTGRGGEFARKVTSRVHVHLCSGICLISRPGRHPRNSIYTALQLYFILPLN